MCRPPSTSAAPLEVLVTASLDEALAAGWAELCPPDELYASPAWLRIEARVSPLAPLYLVVLRRGVPLAATTAHLLGADGPAWPFARIDAVLVRLLGERATPADAPLLARALPSLLAGGRRPGATTVLTRAGLDDASRREAVVALCAALEREAAARGVASLAWLYVEPHDAVLADVLAARGHASFSSAVAARLDVPAGGREAYLARFPSRKRSACQREWRRLVDAGVVHELVPLDAALVEQLLPLELALYDRHGSLFPEGEARRLHHAVIAELGDDVSVLVARAGGAIRGFAVLVRRGDVLYGRQGGFDYAFRGRLPLYFGVVFYALVEAAAARGVRRVEYGIGSDDVKASRGCEVRTQRGFVKLLDDASHGAVAALVARL